MTPDVNVPVAAARVDLPYHLVARHWLQSALAQAGSGMAFTLMPMVVASFLRLVTSPRIFREPTPIDEAIEFVDASLLLPGARLLELGPEWQRFRRLCLRKGLAGNDLPDARLAVAVSQYGEHLAGFDRDFRKLLRRTGWTLLDPATA